MEGNNQTLEVVANRLSALPKSKLMHIGLTVNQSRDRCAIDTKRPRVLTAIYTGDEPVIQRVGLGPVEAMLR